MKSLCADWRCYQLAIIENFLVFLQTIPDIHSLIPNNCHTQKPLSIECSFTNTILLETNFLFNND